MRGPTAAVCVAALLAAASTGCAEGGETAAPPSAQTAPATATAPQSTAQTQTQTTAPEEPADPPPPSLSSSLGPSCRARLHELDVQYAAADAQGRRDARALVRARGRAQRAEEQFRQFLAAHPGSTLPPDEYAVYVQLRARAVGAIDETNTLVKSVNASRAGAYRADRAFAVATDRCLRVEHRWDESADRLERRLEDAAGLVAERGVRVSCASPAAWAEAVPAHKRDAEGYATQGFVRAGSNRMMLAPHVCHALDLLVRRDGPRVRLGCMARELRHGNACPPSLAAVALALVTLAHEAQHTTGTRNEAVAECYGRQKARRVARALQLPATQAERVGAYIVSRSSVPASYRSRQCHDGGRLDIRPSSVVFP